MIPKKPAPDLIRGGNRFSEKIMFKGKKLARRRIGRVIRGGRLCQRAQTGWAKTITECAGLSRHRHGQTIRLGGAPAARNAVAPAGEFCPAALAGDAPLSNAHVSDPCFGPPLQPRATAHVSTLRKHTT
jgi:hypothetical protein